MKVAVLILNWNKSRLTLRAVQSVLASVSTAEVSVVVIDNRSSAEDRRILEQGLGREVVYIASPENLGYAAGNQLGVEWAMKQHADWVWILNNDAYVRPDTLELLIQGAERWPGEAVFSHTTLMAENPDRIHYSGSYDPESVADPAFPYDRRKGLLLEECQHELQDKPATIFGHSLFIPGSILRKYGFMDTRFFLYFEETEYLWRLRKQGVETVYLAAPVCVHESTASQNDDTGKLRPEMERVLKYYFERNKWHWLVKQGKIKKRAVVHAAGGILALTKYFLFNPRPSAEDRASTLYYQNLAMWHAWWGVRGRTVLPPAPIEAAKR
jgi:GT2 family glycosyltransferase